MNTEERKPTATRVGTLELALELKDLPAVLAGLEQIKVAALEAADAVASIGKASALPADRAAFYRASVEAGMISCQGSMEAVSPSSPAIGKAAE